MKRNHTFSVPAFVIGSLLVTVLSCEKRDRLKDEAKILVGEWVWDETTYYYDSCNGPLNWTSPLLPSVPDKEFRLRFYKKGILQYREDGFIFEAYDIIFSDINVNDTATIFKIALNGETALETTAIWDGERLLYSDYPYKQTPCHINGNYFKRVE